MVKSNKIQKNIHHLRMLHRQLANLGPLMRGTVVALGQRRQLMLSLNKDGKTHLLYLGLSRVDRARQYSANYRKLLAIVEEMTILNMQLLKDHVPMEEILPPQGKRRGRYSIWENG